MEGMTIFIDGRLNYALTMTQTKWAYPKWIQIVI